MTLAVKTIFTLFLALVLGLGVVFMTQRQKEQGLVGNWKNFGTNTMVIAADHSIYIRQVKGNVPISSRWELTSSGIDIGKPFGYNDLHDRYYAYILRHNGRTLTMTSDRGETLVFERVK